MIDTKESISSIILLIIGVGICATILIFISVLSGGVYQSTSPQITSLSTLVTNELNSSVFTTPPYLFNTSNGNIWPGSESLSMYNATVIYPLTSSNYVALSYPNGNFNITSLPAGVSTAAKQMFLNITYTYGNPSIKGNITSAIINTFVAVNYTGGYLPLIVLALVIIIILGMVFGIMPMMGGQQMSLPSI